MYKTILEHFPENVVQPAVLVESEQFVIKLAETKSELEKSFRLRYQVFHVEQGKAVKKSEIDGVDLDEFDEYCLHLLVIKKECQTLVGTYRIHLGSIARNAMGFYAAQECKIKGLDSIADITMELGRSCVAPDYRSGSAVALLWGGIGELMMRAGLRYMMGCVSLETKDPAVAWALYHYFEKQNKVSELLTSSPNEGFELKKPATEEINKYFEDERALKKFIPPLFKGYLRLECQVCGEPINDKDFGTIDFLIILDTKKIPDRYSRHYKIT